MAMKPTSSRAVLQLLLVLLLLSATLAIPIGDPHVPSFVCPAWLEEYKAWHRENKGKKGASYLVYLCKPGERCNGTGDRVKGSMFLLRVAAKYRKVLLVKWLAPADITEFLEPASIDWTFKGLSKDLIDEIMDGEPSQFDTGFEIRHGVQGGEQFYAAVKEKKNEAAFNSTKVIRSKTNFYYQDRVVLGGGETVKLKTMFEELYYGRCLFQFLYRPSKAVQKLADETIEALYGDKDAGYVGWHWRSGGAEGEYALVRPAATAPQGLSRLGTLMCGIQCYRNLMAHNVSSSSSSSSGGSSGSGSGKGPGRRAQALAGGEAPGAEATAALAGRRMLPGCKKGAGPWSQSDDPPLLLVTDLNPVRRAVAAGLFQSVVTNNVTSFHLEFQHAGMEGYLNIFVDVLLMARARCMLISYSSMSFLALWAGDHQCYMYIDTCLTEVKKEVLLGHLV